VSCARDPSAEAREGVEDLVGRFPAAERPGTGFCLTGRPGRAVGLAVELGHELAVGGAGSGEVVVAFLEFQLQVDRLLFEGGDPGLELLGVVGGADAHLAPDLLAERFAEALFEAADLGGEAGGAGVGSREVGLNDLGSDWLWSGRVDIDGPGVRVGE